MGRRERSRGKATRRAREALEGDGGSAEPIDTKNLILPGLLRHREKADFLGQNASKKAETGWRLIAGGASAEGAWEGASDEPGGFLALEEIDPEDYEVYLRQEKEAAEQNSAAVAKGKRKALDEETGGPAAKRGRAETARKGTIQRTAVESESEEEGDGSEAESGEQDLDSVDFDDGFDDDSLESFDDSGDSSDSSSGEYVMGDIAEIQRKLQNSGTESGSGSDIGSHNLEADPSESSDMHSFADSADTFDSAVESGPEDVPRDSDLSGDDSEAQMDDEDDEDDDDDVEDVAVDIGAAPARLTDARISDSARGVAYQPGDLAAWEQYNVLDESLLRGLCAMFGPGSVPMPIQENTLLPAIRDHKDIAGVARTGSGKTLAFALPILQGLINDDNAHRLRLMRKESQGSPGRYPAVRGIRALVVAPTRELGLQIAAEIRAVSQFCERFSDKGHGRGPAVVTVVGGISEQKQERLLFGKNGSLADPQVIVATPGRLWKYLEIIQGAGGAAKGGAPAKAHGVQLWRHSTLAELGKTLQFLCVDEADRMVAHRHFPELRSIVGYVQANEHKDRSKAEVAADEDIPPDFFDEMPDYIKSRLGGAAAIRHHEQQLVDSESIPLLEFAPAHRQTFLFSATLSLPPTQLKKKETAPKKGKGKAKRKQDGGSTAEESAVALLIEILQSRGKMAVVDLTGGQRLSPNLLEFQVEVVDRSEKDKLLYYILLNPAHEPSFSLTIPPGSSMKKSPIRRVLVFVSTVDSARRLAGLLRALQIPVWTLHGSQQQKQRMNAIEKFAKDTTFGSNTRVHTLIATDVAARGLDIPLIDMVVHYDVASTPDLYIHRCGRSARTDISGAAVTMVAPVEKIKFKHVLADLQTAELKAAEASGRVLQSRRPVRLLELPLVRPMLRGESVINRRLVAARAIDREENAIRKHEADVAWERKTAREAELASSSDSERGEEDGTGHSVSRVPLHALKGRQRQRAEALDGLSDGDDGVQFYTKRQAAALAKKRQELEMLLHEKIPTVSSVVTARAVAASQALATAGGAGPTANASQNVHSFSSLSIRERGFDKRRAAREFARQMARGESSSSTRGGGSRKRGGRGRGRGRK